jgi:cell division protein ZipA
VPILMESVEDKNRSLPLDERIEPSFSAVTPDSDLDHVNEGQDYEERTTRKMITPMCVNLMMKEMI